MRSSNKSFNSAIVNDPLRISEIIGTMFLGILAMIMSILWYHAEKRNNELLQRLLREQNKLNDYLKSGIELKHFNLN